MQFFAEGGKDPFRLLPLVAATFPKGTAFGGGGKVSGRAKGPILEVHNLSFWNLPAFYDFPRYTYKSIIIIILPQTGTNINSAIRIAWDFVEAV